MNLDNIHDYVCNWDDPFESDFEYKWFIEMGTSFNYIQIYPDLTVVEYNNLDRLPYHCIIKNTQVL